MDTDKVILCSRVPWAKVESVLEAFQSARRDRSKSPLAGLFRSSALDGIEIGRKKRFGWFGEEKTVIPQASSFVVAAIEQATVEAVDVGALPAMDPKLAGFFEPDHGLPEWMHGDKGPSLISPKEIPELLGLLDGPAWEKLAALLARTGEGEGVMVEL